MGAEGHQPMGEERKKKKNKSSRQGRAECSPDSSMGDKKIGGRSVRLGRKEM